MNWIFRLCLVQAFLVASTAYALANKAPVNRDSAKYASEMQRLAKTGSVNKAMQLIKDYDEETIKNQIALAEIQAPPFLEHKFGKPKFFADLLNRYGADSVWIDSIGNTIGLRKGTERKAVLAVAAHMDIVFPEGTDVTVRKSNDTLYGPGIADDNRGLAAILTILRVMNETNIRTKADILFIGNVGEEGLGDLRGTKYLFRDGAPKIDAFISVEPGSINRITNGGLGSHRYRITFNGPGGHSWGGFGRANPIHALGQAAAFFAKEADKYTRDGLKTSYNIGMIGGGTSVNSVPFSAWMEVDMRSLSQTRLVEIDSILQRSIRAGLEEQNKMRRQGDALTVDIEMVGNRPSGHTDSTVSLVQRSMAATTYMGARPKLGTSSTDSNVPISKGIPAVTLGAGGRSGNHHALNEWYLNKNGYKGIQKVLLVIAAEAELK